VGGPSTRALTSKRDDRLAWAESGRQVDICWSVPSSSAAAHLISGDNALLSKPTRACSLPSAALRCTTRRNTQSNFVCRAGYFDGDLAPGFGASAWGLRKVELTGATFLSAFGFLASRLPRCLLPLPIIVHPTGILSFCCPLPTDGPGRLASGYAGASDRTRAAPICKGQMRAGGCRATFDDDRVSGRSGSFHVRVPPPATRRVASK
jgi:hypothetical protein